MFMTSTVIHPTEWERSERMSAGANGRVRVETKR